MPRSQVFSQILHQKCYSNLLTVFYIPLKILTDSKNHFAFLVDEFPEPKPPGGRVRPPLYEEAPPEKRTFLKLQVYIKKVAISQIEVFERVGKSEYLCFRHNVN